MDTEEYKEKKKLLDEIRQKEYYEENKTELIKKITEKKKEKKREQNKEPVFKVIKEEGVLYFN